MSLQRLFTQSMRRFSSKHLLREKMSPSVLNAQYAVRGPIVVRAGQIQDDLKKNTGNYPFKNVIMCNIGNPQELGQKPLTFHRQVLSSILSPSLIESNAYPKDVNERAKRILNDTASYSIGAYTHSQGLTAIRETVCDFICKRDGLTRSDDVVKTSEIFLTDGASPGIKYVLQALIGGPYDGIMIPIPQYPLYSASIDLLGGAKIGYYLDEEKQWGFDIKETRRAVAEAKQKGIAAKAIVFINPGNPTGNVMSDDDIRSAIELAKEENMVILADEVYQQNIYGQNKKFSSFFKILNEMTAKDASYKQVELVSYHSVSKGIFGECGLRGGYMHLCNVENSGYEELYKLVSINLCPNTMGQCTVDLMCNHPKKGDDSYELFTSEYNDLFASLQRRANTLSKHLNEIEGISCQNIEGAMYAFPTISLSKKAAEEARNKQMAPDALYCFELLEKAGICCVPGSGFGQKDGTFHLRTTLLPPENEIQQVVERMAKFHKEFSARY